MGQGLRDFVEKMKTRRPKEVVQVRDEINPKREGAGITLETERHARQPLFN